MNRYSFNFVTAASVMMAATFTTLPAANALDLGLSLGGNHGVNAGVSVGGGQVDASVGVGNADSNSVSADVSADTTGINASVGTNTGLGIDPGVTASIGTNGAPSANIGVSLRGTNPDGSPNNDISIGLNLGGTGDTTSNTPTTGTTGGGALVAFNEMSGGEKARIRKTCKQALGNSGQFERSFVKFCSMLKGLR